MQLYDVYITPASGVGGEFPEPARRNVSLPVARLYAAACRGLGQKARIEQVPAKRTPEKATRLEASDEFAYVLKPGEAERVKEVSDRKGGSR